MLSYKSLRVAVIVTIATLTLVLLGAMLTPGTQLGSVHKAAAQATGCDTCHDSWGRKTWVEDQGRAVLIRVELAEEGAQNHGLRRPILSGQCNEPGTILDAVKKVGKSLPVALAQEEEAGVRCETKGGFPEAVKVKVHWK